MQLVIEGNADTFQADDYQFRQVFDKLTQHFLVQGVQVSNCQCMLLFGISQYVMSIMSQ